MALETSPERPAAVRTIARLVDGYIARLGAVWVEGQVAQLSRRPGAGLAFVTLRDTEADMSVTVTATPTLVRPPAKTLRTDTASMRPRPRGRGNLPTFT